MADGACGLDLLPSVLLATIMTKLDVASICSLGATCNTLRSCALHIRSLYIGSVAEKRGRAIHVSDLEELLSGCNELETQLTRNFGPPFALKSDIRSFALTSSSSQSEDRMKGSHKVLRWVAAWKVEQINQHGKLKHLLLVRSQEFLVSYFRRVNDLDILLMADRCSSMESICLGGFCRVTDTGFRAILHSSSSLCKLKVSHGAKLTDLLFLDNSATSLSLSHVTLRWCYCLSNLAISHLASKMDLAFLDLRDCRSLGDEALMAIGALPKLKTLLLDGCDVSDVGMSYLKNAVTSTLISLSVRGCKRLTDKCIMALFGSSAKVVLQELDLSSLPYLSDNGVLLLAKSHVDDEMWHGNGLRVLDLYNCGRITALAFRWLKRPYFPRLRWLGVARSVNRDLVDALARSRPYLRG
ncbi:F-box/LRR-repeat protein 10-like protein [Drosera capensis]